MVACITSCMEMSTIWSGTLSDARLLIYVALHLCKAFLVLSHFLGYLTMDSRPKSREALHTKLLLLTLAQNLQLWTLYLHC